MDMMQAFIDRIVNIYVSSSSYFVSILCRKLRFHKFFSSLFLKSHQNNGSISFSSETKWEAECVCVCTGEGSGLKLGCNF